MTINSQNETPKPDVAPVASPTNPQSTPQQNQGDSKPASPPQQK
jgi:hypothetical protein